MLLTTYEKILFKKEREVIISGTVAGGKKAATTNIAKYGKDFFSSIGRKGGKASTTGGFYANRRLASEAGRRGGRKAKRGWKIIKETPMFITYKRTNGEETMRIRKEELGVI